jgi:N utilization substance protein A
MSEEALNIVKSDFMMAINQVCHERQLPVDIVLEAVEVALVSAYKRNFGGNQSITAQIGSQAGEP